MPVQAGHISILLEGPDDLLADLSNWAGFVTRAPSDPLMPCLLTIRVELEPVPGAAGSEVGYIHRGRIGGKRWMASSPAWWEAEGRGLEQVRCRVHTGGPGGARLAVRSLLRFLVAEAAVRTGGLALHAAAVSRPEGAAVLLAPSGGGKTTLARTFGKDSILADDFCLISPVGDRLRVPVSPFPGREETMPTGQPAWLWRVAEVVKAQSVAFLPVSRSEAVGTVLRFAISFAPDRGSLDALLGTAIRVATETVVGRLWANLEDEPWGVM